MPIFVGLDCGGSSTRVLAMEGTTEVHRGQSGPANLLSTPRKLLASNLARACDGCPPADAVCGCFAGLVDEQIRAEALEILASHFPGAALRAEPDYSAALAACGPRADACVIAGTGSIVCSRDNHGLHKTGGRGPLLQDPGSAAEIGREVVSLVLNEDRGVSPELLNEVDKIFGSSEASGLVARLYQSKAPAATLAKLVKPAAKEAIRGNTEVRALLAAEMRELASMVSRHLSQFLSQKSTITLGLAGGLWRSHPVYAEMFRIEISNLNPNYSIEAFLLTTPPVEGAVQLARELMVGH